MKIYLEAVPQLLSKGLQAPPHLPTYSGSVSNEDFNGLRSLFFENLVCASADGKFAFRLKSVQLFNAVALFLETYLGNKNL